MTNEEIEQCKKSVKLLLDNYCKGCSGNFGSCLDCLDEQELLEEETIWVIDELQKEYLKQKEILDILINFASTYPIYDLSGNYSMAWRQIEIKIEDYAGEDFNIINDWLENNDNYKKAKEGLNNEK